MGNYIDSDRIDLKNYLMHKDGKVLYSDDFFAGIKWVLDRIDEMPSIEIVRCSECEYWHKNRKEGDGMNVFDVCYDFQADDFCSYGEREGE